jgi:hypothetical protein
MKCDMGGAGAVLGAARSLMMLKPSAVQVGAAVQRSRHVCQTPAFDLLPMCDSNQKPVGKVGFTKCRILHCCMV